MDPTLDLALLRTLAAATEVGGLMRAASALGLSRPAISVRMRRLEDQVGAKLFRKDGRRAVLTREGEVLLGYARRLLALNDEALAAFRPGAAPGAIRVGAPQDLAARALPHALRRFDRATPGAVVEARVDGNAALRDALEHGRLDLALVFGTPASGSSDEVAELPMTWIGSPALGWKPPAPLPLALLESPCIFRAAALSALDAAGLRWRVAFQSASLAAVWAAAQAGLGVTVRTRLGVPAGLRAGLGGKKLPDLPSVGLWSCTAAAELPAPAARLRTELEAAVREELSSSRGVRVRV
ncbi:MAG: LysR substrate-binding domain-containing protein [Anaeromyxobacteraceae bacterium]